MNYNVYAELVDCTEFCDPEPLTLLEITVVRFLVVPVERSSVMV